MATNNLDIIVRVTDDGSGKLLQTAKALENVGDAATKAGAKTKQAAGAFTEMANRVDSAGRNARIGLSSMAQAADLVGVNLSGVIGPAASAADAIGDIVGSIGTLGATAGVIGGVIVAVGLLNTALQKQHDTLAKTITLNDAYLWSLHGLAQESPAVAAGIAEIANQLATLRQAASANPLESAFGSFAVGKAQIDDFFNALDSGLVRFRSFGEILNENKAQLDAVAFGMQSGYDEVEHLRGAMDGLIVTTDNATNSAAAHAQALDYEAAAARRMAAAMGDTRGDAISGRRDDGRALSKQKTDAAWGDMVFVPGVGWVNKEQQGKQKASQQAFQQTLDQTAQKLRGLIEGALNPTSVEQRLGMVGDAWDELRLRLEAVATGTDPSQYGAGFQAQLTELEKMGYTAESAAKAMKDFSFYADPANVKFADFGPLTAQIEQQLLGLAGKANLTAAAMKDVWKNLSPTAKAALAEQGINSASDAIDALADPTQQAKTQVQGLNDALGAIPRAITTTFTVIKDAAETAITEFRTVLDKFIADYGNVVISINAETTAVPPGTNTPPPAGPPSGNYARGLDFIVPPGFPNDSYSFRGNLTSGERVTVTPQGSAAAPNIIVYVMDENGNARRARKVRALAAMGA